MLSDKLLKFCKETPEPCTKESFDAFLKAQSINNDAIPLLLDAATRFNRVDLLKYTLIDEQTSQLKTCFQKQNLTDTLLSACLYGSDTAAGFLISLGADVNGANNLRNNNTPLHMAALSHSDYLVSVLKQLKNKTENEVHDEEEELGEIICDLNFRKIKIIELLLDKGAKINTKNNYGETPLHLASKLDFSNKVQTLIDGGADVNALDSKNRTPLHYATNYMVCLSLLDKGAKINARDIDGKAPLHLLIENDDFICAQFLIRKGADVFATFKDDKGVYKTASDIIPEGDKYNSLREEIKERKTNKAYLKHITNEATEFLSSHLLAVACVAAVAIGVALYVRGASVSLPSGMLKGALNSVDKAKSLAI